MNTSKDYPLWFTATTLLILIVSGFFAIDKFTWVMEEFPTFFSLPILFYTYKKFKFTPMIYWIVLFHYFILAVGGVYTYAKVPFGFWMQDWFGFSRNHFDRIGHFLQGFVPALIVRELLLRTSPLRPSKGLNYIVVAICLCNSAAYEFIEWWTSASQGASADAFLGTQGDEWDAQKDMLMCVIGAITALVAVSHYQNKLLKKMLGEDVLK